MTKLCLILNWLTRSQNASWTSCTVKIQLAYLQWCIQQLQASKFDAVILACIHHWFTREPHACRRQSYQTTLAAKAQTAFLQLLVRRDTESMVAVWSSHLNRFDRFFPTLCTSYAVQAWTDEHNFSQATIALSCEDIRITFVSAVAWWLWSPCFSLQHPRSRTHGAAVGAAVENQLKPKHNSFTAPRPRSNLARSLYGVQLPLSWQTCT